MAASRLVLIAVIVVAALGPRAHASCNTIPVRPLFVGDRGSIDRPFLSPDADQRVTITYATDSAAANAIVGGEPLITLVFKPPGAKPYTYYIAPSDKACRRLAGPRRGLARLFCREHRNCVTARDVGLEIDSERSQLSFRPPRTGAAGPVAIAVSNSMSPPPLELQSQSCSMLLMSNKTGAMPSAMSAETGTTTSKESPDDTDIVVCIDAFSSGSDSSGGSALASLLYLPPSHDYDEVCTHHLEDPKCLGGASDIDFTTDTDGNVTMRMVWKKSLLPKTAPGEFRRRTLRAGIAVGAHTGELDRIRIPSAAFLQTTTTQGGGFSPGPEFAPVEFDGRFEEQVFSGTADKGDSVLRFARRTRWQYVCDAGTNKDQACEPSTTSTSSNDCPGGQCVFSNSPAEYFACVGGDRARLPCTQAAQCTGTGATCEPVSKKGSICYQFGGTPVSPQKKCTLDSDCGAGAECGLGLFDFRNRPDIPIVNGIGQIKRQANQVRGVCDSGHFEDVKCTTNSFCRSSGFRLAKCVRFRASALRSDSN